MLEYFEQLENGTDRANETTPMNLFKQERVTHLNENGKDVLDDDHGRQ